MAIILTHAGKVVTHDGQVVYYDATYKDVWLKCIDDTAAVNYAAADSNKPTDDYAWICIGGVWDRCGDHGSPVKLVSVEQGDRVSARLTHVGKVDAEFK